MKTIPLRRPTGQAQIRAAAAILLCRSEGRHLKNILADHWPGDRDLETITRAATTPATEANTSQLVGLEVANVVDLLGGASTNRRLFELGTQFRFDGTGQIQVPSIADDSSAVTFIGPGAPIPVRKSDVAPFVLLKPAKLATISVFTEESTRTTTPNLETLVRQKISDDIDLGLDKLLLDATASSATRPAGLRNGINASSASAATSPVEAMAEDVATVVGAVATVARNAPVALVAAPPQAAALRLWSRPNFNYEVLSSAGLADGVLLAIATNTLVSAADPPRFSVTDQAVVHFDNSAPRDIDGTAVAATVKSLFQSNLIGLRVTADVSWALRSSSGVAWVENTAW